jgi:hypothetical protein
MATTTVKAPKKAKKTALKPKGTAKLPIGLVELPPKESQGDALLTEIFSDSAGKVGKKAAKNKKVEAPKEPVKLESPLLAEKQKKLMAAESRRVEIEVVLDEIYHNGPICNRYAIGAGEVYTVVSGEGDEKILGRKVSAKQAPKIRRMLELEWEALATIWEDAPDMSNVFGVASIKDSFIQNGGRLRVFSPSPGNISNADGNVVLQRANINGEPKWLPVLRAKPETTKPAPVSGTPVASAPAAPVPPVLSITLDDLDTIGQQVPEVSVATLTKILRILKASKGV